MSTRANVEIVSPAQGLTFYYEIRSDGYPERIAGLLAEYDGSPESLTDLYLSPGQVGNPDYFYRLDVGYGTLQVWNSTTYWQNAPKNWKEKGYNCWKDGRGRYGYTNWRKSKREYQYEYGTRMAGFYGNPNAAKSTYRGEIQIIPNDRYTKEQLRSVKNNWEMAGYYIKKLKCDPNVVHTWMLPCDCHYKEFYTKKLECMPLQISSQFDIEREVAKWRLRVHA